MVDFACPPYVSARLRRVSIACWSRKRVSSYNSSSRVKGVVKLTIRVALNFNHHLLETPDGLVAAILGHLLAKVILGALLSILFSLESALLVLLEPYPCSRQERSRLLSASRLSTAFDRASLASLLRVIGRVVLSIVHGLLACLLDIASAERLVLTILILRLGL